MQGAGGGGPAGAPDAGSEAAAPRLGRGFNPSAFVVAGGDGRSGAGAAGEGAGARRLRPARARCRPRPVPEARPGPGPPAPSPTPAREPASIARPVGGRGRGPRGFVPRRCLGPLA